MAHLREGHHRLHGDRPPRRGLHHDALEQRGTHPQYSKKALEYLKQAIDAGSTNAFDYFNYATLLHQLRRNGAALKRAAEALTHDPLHARARGLMGYCMYHDAQREEGAREIALAREIAPDDQQIWYWQLAVEDLEIKRREQGG
ncbi:MAG: hypothetical protein HC813_00190 [Planctomycetes bacterium]|nr:hypothetical protein [Planctomycetota bacterium]